MQTKPRPLQNGHHQQYGSAAADSPWQSPVQQQALAQESAALMAELEAVGKVWTSRGN